MKKILTGMVMLAVVCAAWSDEVRIVHPRLFVNMKSAKASSHGAKTVTYTAMASIYLYNASKTTIRIPTKCNGISSCVGRSKNTGKFTGALMDLPEKTMLIEFDFNSHMSIAADKKTGTPEIPIIRSESEWDIVALRPGEAAAVFYEFNIRKSWLDSADKVIFAYRSDNKKRYDFASIQVISIPYSFSDNKVVSFLPNAFYK